MDKVIDDMASAMFQNEFEQDFDTCDFESCEIIKTVCLSNAKAARATLPEFIVLDEDAEPEVGDEVICDKGYVYVLHGQTAGNCEITLDELLGKIRQDNMRYKIRTRKGVSVLIRKKKK